MTEKLLSLSIDLDALDLYLGLYGLNDALEDAGKDAIPAQASERFGDLCASLGVPGTIFAVGRDLAAGQGREEIRKLSEAGHEIASHSFAHDYALTRRSPEDIDADLAQAEEVIASVTGHKPTGFRAPGYTLSPRLLETLRARGYAYDSSLLPSPPYYAAKAAAIGALALAGKRSRSILGPMGQLISPRGPRRERGLVELPISVLPGVRIPVIGTLLATAPQALSKTMCAGLARDPLIVIELHGVDLCDESDGVPPALAARQRDLRVPATTKRKRIESALTTLMRGRKTVTLAQAARMV